MRSLIFRVIVAVALLSSAVSAQNDAEIEKTDSSPKKTVVTADRMISEADKNRYRFIGNVRARHGEITLVANELELYTDEEKKMKRIVAMGDVVITKGKRIATGQHAVMYNDEKKLVITENASITEDSSNITGEKIIYFYEKEDIIVGGDEKGRASFKILPSGNNNEDNESGEESEKQPSPPEN